MLKSNVLIKTLNIVMDLKNKIYYDHISSLLERKERI